MVVVMQKRAQITRDTVLQHAAREFASQGYVHATLNGIIGSSGTTKGALHFHFSSKETLARAVIDEGLTRFERTYAQRIESHSRAFELLIEISYAMAGYGRDDHVIRAAFRLVTEIGDYRGGSRTVAFDNWITTCRELARRALTEGDLRDDSDPDELGLLLVHMAYGIRLLSEASENPDHLLEGIATSWQLLLPALVDAPKEEYFRQFAARRLWSVMKPRATVPVR
nr:ScbR family autoregulator-binding transcription factor [Rhodococcus wratislaviensis]